MLTEIIEMMKLVKSKQTELKKKYFACIKDIHSEWFSSRIQNAKMPRTLTRISRWLVCSSSLLQK